MPRTDTRVYPKVSGLCHNEINNNNKHSLRTNTKGYGGKNHYTDSQNNDTAAPNGRKLYHLQYSPPGGLSGNFWIHLRMYVVENQGKESLEWVGKSYMSDC
jgi:hypothetical protein